MSKRSVRKVRHIAPPPSFRDRAISNKQPKDGGDGINLMEVWHANVNRYQTAVLQKVAKPLEGTWNDMTPFTREEPNLDDHLRQRARREAKRAAKKASNVVDEVAVQDVPLALPPAE